MTPIHTPEIDPAEPAAWLAALIQQLAAEAHELPLNTESPPEGFMTFVVIAFDSVERAQAWYDSPAYAAIKPLRQQAAKSRVFMAAGVTPK